MSSQAKIELIHALEEKRRRIVARERESIPKDFAAFVRGAWHVVEPAKPLHWNWHLDVTCAYIEAYHARKIRNLIINQPPGTMKSLLASVFYPAWAWINDPSRRFVNLTNELGLALRDNRRMRDVVTSVWYQERWGEKVALSKDKHGETLFHNTATGFRQGLGMGGNITGKRGTDLIIDDPIDAKKAFSDVENQSALTTYDQAVSSRLNNPREDGKLLIAQRTRVNDLPGHLMAKTQQHWVVLSIPMEYEGYQTFDAGKDIGRPDLIDPRTKVGELLLPKLFGPAEVAALKEDLGEFGSAGQLQQRPVPLGGGILKSAYWKKWERAQLPEITHVFTSWDTAYSSRDHKDSAFSARTDWGIFHEKGKWKMILLGYWAERAEYSELLAEATRVTHKKKPHTHLIESKASGLSMIQDLRKVVAEVGGEVRGYNPSRDGDKIARMYLAQPTFASGLVYYVDRPFSKTVIDNVAQAPNGAPPSADITDTVTQAVLYMKRRQWIGDGYEEDDYQTEVESAYG